MVAAAFAVVFIAPLEIVNLSKLVRRLILFSANRGSHAVGCRLPNRINS
jgi:hypothetical protein